MRTTVKRATMGLALAAITGIGIDVGTASASTNSPGAGDEAASAGGSGNLYAATNAITGNAIRTFHRAPDGQLTLVGDTPTGGLGSGSFESSANAVVLGGAAGESSPINVTGVEKFLFAVNTGSNSVSVFRTDRQPRACVRPQRRHHQRDGRPLVHHRLPAVG